MSSRKSLITGHFCKVWIEEIQAMKVTLVQPKYFNIWEAIGLGYIGAYAKKKFPGKLEINLFQGNFDDDQIIIDDAKTSDIVAFSCTSPVFRAAVNLAAAIKSINPKVRTVFGGFHPTAVPDDCLEEEAIDQVIVGEGETAFLKVLLGETASIVRGERFLDFNDIFPDRELIKNHRTVDLCERQINQRITSFQSTRVCPFNCAFCSERIITGDFHRKNNPLRIRDPKHLLEEIQWVARKYSLDYFKFVDATWNTSTEKIISFCEEKIKQNVKLPWDANVHASFANKEMLKAMKAANCKLINVGCESGSQKILRDIRKGLTIEKIKQVFEWGQEIGIERRGFFLMGMPNESEEDLKLTENLVEEIKPDVFGITILCPYPGTDFYDPATMKNFDWTFADEYSNPYWETVYFSNAELKQKQKYLADKFASSLSWHNRLIKENSELCNA
jgi:anaerobic magnesium-protoporphyrin IX monomethyl ester cyclase